MIWINKKKVLTNLEVFSLQQLYYGRREGNPLSTTNNRTECCALLI